MAKLDTAVIDGYHRSFGDNERMPDKEYYKKPLYPLWLECYKVFLMFAVPMFVVLFIGYYLGGAYFAYFAAGWMVFPILSTIIRRKVKNLILFLLAHGVMGCYLLLSPAEVLTVLGVVYLIVVVVYGTVRQMSKEPEREMGYAMMFAAFFFMMVTYLVADYLGRNRYLMHVVIQSLVYVVLYLYYEHRTSVMDALKAMDKQGNFSNRQILRFNSGVFFVYMGFMVILFALLNFLGFGKVISLLGKYLMLLIRRIVRALLRAEATPEAEQQEEEIVQQMEAEIGGGLWGGETSAFWDAAQRVLVVVFVIFMIALIVYLVVTFYKKFNASYAYSGTGYEETKTFYTEDGVEETAMPRPRLFDRSIENRIRRAYYRKVRGAMGKKVTRSDTPQEVAGKMPELKDLVPEYEKVRYGQEKNEDKG